MSLSFDPNFTKEIEYNESAACYRSKSNSHIMRKSVNQLKHEYTVVTLERDPTLNLI